MIRSGSLDFSPTKLKNSIEHFTNIDHPTRYVVPRVLQQKIEDVKLEFEKSDYLERRRRESTKAKVIARYHKPFRTESVENNTARGEEQRL